MQKFDPESKDEKEGQKIIPALANKKDRSVIRPKKILVLLHSLAAFFKVLNKFSPPSLAKFMQPFEKTFWSCRAISPSLRRKLFFFL